MPDARRRMRFRLRAWPGPPFTRGMIVSFLLQLSLSQRPEAWLSRPIGRELGGDIKYVKRKGSRAFRYVFTFYVFTFATTSTLPSPSPRPPARARSAWGVWPSHP